MDHCEANKKARTTVGNSENFRDTSRRSKRVAIRSIQYEKINEAQLSNVNPQFIVKDVEDVLLRNVRAIEASNNFLAKKFDGISFYHQVKGGTGMVEIDQMDDVIALQNSMINMLPKSCHSVGAGVNCKSSFLHSKPRGGKRHQAFHRDVPKENCLLKYFSLAPLTEKGCFLFVVLDKKLYLIYIPYGKVLFVRGDIVHSGGITCEQVNYQPYTRIHTFFDPLGIPDRDNTKTCPQDEQPTVDYNENFDNESNLPYIDTLDHELGSSIQKAFNDGATTFLDIICAINNNR